MADADAEEFSRWAATASTNAQRTELNKQLSRIESAINYFEHLQALLRVEEDALKRAMSKLQASAPPPNEGDTDEAASAKLPPLNLSQEEADLFLDEPGQAPDKP
eukprot:m.48781 g.48781  ORF g.48781 m.48781 type:complete len:105 (+) comp47795_c0_seq3:84-398(+)